jgi:hypothetical protein
MKRPKIPPVMVVRCCRDGKRVTVLMALIRMRISLAINLKVQTLRPENLAVISEHAIPEVTAEVSALLIRLERV